MAELHHRASTGELHGAAVFAHDGSSSADLAELPKFASRTEESNLLRVCTDPVDLAGGTSERGGGKADLGRSYSVQVRSSSQAATGEARRGRRSEDGGRRWGGAGLVDISALDRALDRVMSLSWRNKGDARGGGEKGLGLGASARQEKGVGGATGATGGRGGRHGRERARSQGEEELSPYVAAAAAAAAALAAAITGEPVAADESAAARTSSRIPPVAVPLQKCAKQSVEKTCAADKDGVRGANDSGVADEPSWQVDLRRVTIKKEIVKGAYTAVYKGAYRDTDVAVKAIEWGEDGSSSPLLRARQRAALRRQVDVWHRLKHPYVLQLLGAHIGQESAARSPPLGVDARLRGVAGCLIMEHVGEMSLKEYLGRAAKERRKLPLHMVVGLAMQLAKGLAYIHSSRVVHGDLCPDNLLLTDRRRLKIAGFGVARFEKDCRAWGRAGRETGEGEGGEEGGEEGREERREAGTGAAAAERFGNEIGAVASGVGKGWDLEALAHEADELDSFLLPSPVSWREEEHFAAGDAVAGERSAEGCGEGGTVAVEGRNGAGEAQEFEVAEAAGGAKAGRETKAEEEAGKELGLGLSPPLSGAKDDAGVGAEGEDGGGAGEAQEGGGWLPHDASGETGSVGYMAPEVLAGQPYDRRADVYSFGICLWELLTSETPFDSFDLSEMASAISEGVRPIIPPKCPSDLANVMRCCWEPLPASRPSMPQVIALLQKANVFWVKEIPAHNI